MFINRKSITSKDWILFVLIGFAIGLISVGPSFDLRSRAGGTPANIIIDASSSGERISTEWFHAFSQGGEESTDMIGPVVAPVSALSPSYIRIDHIYDGYATVTRNTQGLQYDWTRLDQALDSIVKTGATPVLALSYMPDVIAKDGSIIRQPNVWLEWTEVVKATIEHVSGTKRITNVYYEVWNEPDLGQFGGWKYYGDLNYLTLYAFAARGASRANQVQPFKLGGPSTTAMYTAWIDALVKNGHRLDFLSWHVYDKRTTRIREDILKFQEKYRDNEHIRTLPILITEYGFTGSKDALYSSSYAAAYTAATIRQVWDLNPRPILFTFQLKDGPSQEDGWGIIGHESKGAIKKPRYHAFSFLDQLKGERLTLTGEGSWVTALAYKDEATIRVVFINVDPDTPGAIHSENVPVTIEHLPPGQYTMRLRYFLGSDTTKGIHIIDGNPRKIEVYIPANSLVLLEVSPKK